MKPRICVVGTGYWGKNLVRNFHALDVLRSVCDESQQTLEKMVAQYSGVSGIHDYKKVLTDPEIDAVALATPAEQHFAMAKAALEAGKHVFCEKPLALEVAEGEELCEVCDRTGRILMVGHLLEYHPAVIKLKELVAKGELGKINYIYSNRLNLGKIRNEENILWSFAPHDISVILLLLGEEPNSMRAFGGAYLQQKIVDVTVSTLDFPSGTRAHIFVSWLHPYKEQRLIVIGDKRMAVFNDVDPQHKLVLYDTSIEWVDRMPVAKKPEGEAVGFPQTEPLREECAHFVQCIEQGKQPRTDCRSALRVLRVLKGCQLSLEKDGVPVKMSDVNAKKSLGKNAFVHHTSFVDEGSKIGEGTKVWHFSHVLKNCTIGKDCNIGQNVVIGPDVTIGNNAKIQNNVSVYKDVTLEDDVFCGPSMVFTNVHNPRSHVSRKHEYRKTLVKRGASLGANCTVVCGSTIGQYAFVGAGSVVTKDVPAYALVYGNPARQQGWICWCGVKLDFAKGKATACPECGRQYRKLSETAIEESKKS